MCLDIVEQVVGDDNLMQMLHINEDWWPNIRKSWYEGKPDLLGRFDFAWDGVNPPKLLEYNGDTPSMLAESSEVQYAWYQ